MMITDYLVIVIHSTGIVIVVSTPYIVVVDSGVDVFSEKRPWWD